jgi:hypothetical protein
MTFRTMTLSKSILLLLSLSLIAALVACSSSSSTPVTTTPPPPAITVTLGSISTPLTVNSQTSITATVLNDSTNAGVKWSVACAGSTGCGSFNPTTSSGSSATTIYTAPAFPTTGVVITATSVTTPTISAASSAITIGAATLANGTYVFNVTGYDYNDESLFHLGGAFTVSAGAITQGEQDFVDFNFELSDQINPVGSSVTTTGDGNVQITLVTCLGSDCTQPDTNVGVNGTETLNGSVYPLNPSKAAITEFDASATGSGELDTQDTTAFVVGTPPGPASYAFVIGGYDQFSEGGFPFNMGGIINVDGAAGTGTISGTGSIFDANDSLSNGTTYPAQDFANTSIVLGPDAFGRVTVALDSSVFPEIVLAGYIVNGNKMQLVETADSYEGTLGGIAYTQTVPAGGFTNAGIAGSTYVLGLQGSDTFNFILQAASQLTLAPTGNTVSGFVDFNDFSATQPVSPDPVTAPAYAIDTAGTGGTGVGDVTIGDVTDTQGVVNYNLQLYLDGNGHALAITLDLTDVTGGPGFQQSGTGAFAATSFSGAYAMGATGWDFNEYGPFDAVGPQVADGSSTFSGFNDVNWLNVITPSPFEVPGAPVSGTFTSNADGIFTGTVTGLDLTNCPLFTSGAAGCTADVFNFYLVDATGDNIAIETDPNQLTLGYFIQQ